MSGETLGILSLTDPHKSLESGDDREILLAEADLAHVLRERDYRVGTGGMAFGEEDRLASSPSMARTHIHTLVDFGVRCVILNVTAGGRGGDAVAAVRYLEREFDAPCRLLLYADVSRVPAASNTLLNVARALRRAGFPHSVLEGSPFDSGFMDDLENCLRFNLTRTAVSERCCSVISELKIQKLVCFGSTSDSQETPGIDADLLMNTFGVGIETGDWNDVEHLAAELLGNEGGSLPDSRIRAVVEHHSSRQNGDSLEALTRQLAVYHAITDLMRECEGTFATLDDCVSPGGRFASWLSDTHGPDGVAKDMVPTAPCGDSETALTQLVFSLYEGVPSALVEIQEVDGQSLVVGHACPLPAHFVEDEGETPGRPVAGRYLTLARFRNVRGRYALFALETETADPGEGSEYGASLRMPLSSPDFTAFWPNGSAAISFGHHGAALAELAHRLDLDYSIVDAAGHRFERGE